MTNTVKFIVKSFVANATRSEGTGNVFTGTIDGVPATAWVNSTTLQTIIGKNLLSSLNDKFSETLVTLLTSGSVLDVEFKEEGAEQTNRAGEVIATIKNSHYSVVLKGTEVAVNDAVTIAVDLLSARINKLPIDVRKTVSLLSLMRDSTFKEDFNTAVYIYGV